MAKKQKKINHDINLFIISLFAVFTISVALISMINIITINVASTNDIGYQYPAPDKEDIDNTNLDKPVHDLLIMPASEIKK